MIQQRKWQLRGRQCKRRRWGRWGWHCERRKLSGRGSWRPRQGSKSSALVFQIQPFPNRSGRRRRLPSHHRYNSQIPLQEKAAPADTQRETGRKFWTRPASNIKVAVLRYLGQHTTLAVPKVEAVDFAGNSALEGPDVIITRIPGHDLDHLGFGKISQWPQPGAAKLSCERTGRDFAWRYRRQAVPCLVGSNLSMIETELRPLKSYLSKKEQVPNGSSRLFDFPFVDEAGIELPDANQVTETLPYNSTLDWFLS